MPNHPGHPALASSQELITGPGRISSALDAISVQTVTSSGYIRPRDGRYIIVQPSESITLTLPDPDSDPAFQNIRIVLKRTTGGLSTVTVVAGGTSTIDGASSFTLDAQYDCEVLFSSSTTGQWHRMRKAPNLLAPDYLDFGDWIVGTDDSNPAPTATSDQYVALDGTTTADKIEWDNSTELADESWAEPGAASIEAGDTAEYSFYIDSEVGDGVKTVLEIGDSSVPQIIEQATVVFSNVLARAGTGQQLLTVDDGVENLLPVDLDGFPTQTNLTLTQSAIAAPDGTLTAWDCTSAASGGNSLGWLSYALSYNTTKTATWYVYQPSIPTTGPYYNMNLLEAGGGQITVRLDPSGSIVYFVGINTGPTLTAERSVSVEAVGDSGWLRLTATMEHYPGSSGYFQVVPISGSPTSSTVTLWNPTLRYGDWVSRGKNWLTANDLSAWSYNATNGQLTPSLTPAPDGTLSAYDFDTITTVDTGISSGYHTIPTTGGAWTYEFWVNHADAHWDDGKIYFYLYASAGFTERVYLRLNQAGGSTFLNTIQTSGPGYTLADHVQQEAIGSDGWWRYRITLFDYANNAINSVHYWYVLDAGSAGRSTIWNPRLKVGNPADARGYFVSGPQNLLGDGSDYSGWTAGVH